jgi:hypothetical protein
MLRKAYHGLPNGGRARADLAACPKLQASSRKVQRVGNLGGQLNCRKVLISLIDPRKGWWRLAGICQLLRSLSRTVAPRRRGLAVSKSIFTLIDPGWLRREVDALGFHLKHQETHHVPDSQF